jgi:glycosyltransferase involved in cell wall biosynthesis
VIDATVLIPTHAHARLIPHALHSALAQEGVQLEVLVVGDGVGDDTRAALEPFLRDNRVRFLDNPKGERHGEAHRHAALAEAHGRIVCYLSDDDLFLPDHVSEMARLLEDADFAHTAPVRIEVDGRLKVRAFDLGRPELVETIRAGRNAIGLTAVAHTLDAYRRLPKGWNPAPPTKATDLHMWQQWCEQPWFRGVSGTRMTILHFPSGLRAACTEDERVAELESWVTRSAQPGFRAELDRLLAAAAMEAARDERLAAITLERQLDRMQSTRWWRARRRLAQLRLGRALRSRSRAAG